MGDSSGGRDPSGPGGGADPPSGGQGGYPPGGYPPGQFPPPGYGPGYPPPPPGVPNSGRSVAILVLGIASLVTVICAGVLMAVIALCLAPGAQREIAAAQGRLGGEGLVRAGKICSWISIGVSLLIIILFAAFFTFSVSTGFSNVGLRTG